MKIVILNDCFFNQTHLNKLKTLGDLKIFDKTNTAQLAIERINDADIAIVDQFLTTYDSTIFKACPKLKLLALNTTAYSEVDLDTASQNNTKVANIPGFSKQSVAELAIGLMFAVVRQIPRGDTTFRAHPIDDLDPVSQAGRSFIGFELKGKTLGVIGLGNIGSIVAHLAQGLGMKVLGYNRSPKNIPGVQQVDLPQLLQKSDIVSLHLPLNSDSDNLISTQEISLMKKHAIILNLGRGKLINTKALHHALSTHQIAGAGLDVVELDTNDPLLKLSNVVFTPHIGSYTKESFEQNLPNIIISNITSFINNKPQNLVN